MTGLLGAISNFPVPPPPFLSVYFFRVYFFFDALSWSPARSNRGPQVLSMSRHSGSVSPQEQRVLFTPPTIGSDSTIRPDFEPGQVLDDLVSQWFEEIEETESPNKQLLPQFNLCAVRVPPWCRRRIRASP